jgi:putative redox protein
MHNIEVRFLNDAGTSLAGILDLPASTPRAFALFAHCFTCGKNLKSATNISAAMTAADIAVLRFDFTGLGQSEGDFAATSFSSNVSDLVAAARFLEAEYEAPSILVGHSLGGTAVLEAAHEIPSALAVATIGSPADPEHVTRLFGDARGDIEAHGAFEVRLGGRPFMIRREFLDDLRRHDLPNAIGGLRKALLVMHAPLDATVGIDNAASLFAAAKHPKSFVSLDRADHLLTNNEDSAWAGHVLSAWASRFLPAETTAGDLAAPEGVVVAQTPIDSFRTEIKSGRHHLLADEPASVGGTDVGPSPYGLLSAALAACTSMTLKMYATHKKLDLDFVTVRVRHRKIHAEDCADCESDDGWVDEFQREIVFDGAVDERQRARLLEIADRCPVHRSLEGEVRIRTRQGGPT